MSEHIKTWQERFADVSMPPPADLKMKDVYTASMAKSAEIADLRAALSARSADGVDAWIDVNDRLPETYVYNDRPCKLGGKDIAPAIRSERVLVTLVCGAVREDRLDGLQGATPWFERYNKRVTHWKPMPASALAQVGKGGEQDA